MSFANDLLCAVFFNQSNGCICVRVRDKALSHSNVIRSRMGMCTPHQQTRSGSLQRVAIEHDAIGYIAATSEQLAITLMLTPRCHLQLRSHRRTKQLYAAHSYRTDQRSRAKSDHKFKLRKQTDCTDTLTCTTNTSNDYHLECLLIAVYI